MKLFFIAYYSLPKANWVQGPADSSKQDMTLCCTWNIKHGTWETAASLSQAGDIKIRSNLNREEALIQTTVDKNVLIGFQWGKLTFHSGHRIIRH